MNLFYVILIGGVAGWLAGLILKGRGFGIPGNVVVGIIGAFVGHFLLGLTGFSSQGGIAATLITAVVGAIVLLSVIGLMRKR